jgi:peroxiredoxin
LVLTGLVVTWIGCQQAPPPEKEPAPAKEQASHDENAQPPAASETPEGNPPEGTAKVEPPAPKPEPPPAPKVPEVHLPEQLAKTTLVRVGNPMPDGELTTLDGKKEPLKSFFGDKLTVVFFWKGNDTYAQMAAVDALQYLEEEVVKRYGEKGLRAVAVNVGDTPEAARERVNEAKATFPSLLDLQGDYFAKIATERLPRIYLLDGQGKVIWLDTEYSRATRQNLSQALRAELGDASTKNP